MDKTATCKAKRFIPVYRLGEDGDLLKEGGGMLLVWALRARSYKTKAEACHQGNALHPPQGVYLVFVLLKTDHPNALCMTKTEIAPFPICSNIRISNSI